MGQSERAEQAPIQTVYRPAGAREVQFASGVGRRKWAGTMAGQEMTDERSGQTFEQLKFFMALKDARRGWIFRFFAAPAEAEQNGTGRLLWKVRPVLLLFAGYRRRSGCVPAGPYPPLKHLPDYPSLARWQ
jgi:hypothetical protein